MTILQRFGLSILLFGLAWLVVAVLEGGSSTREIAIGVLFAAVGWMVFVFSDCREDK